MNVWMALVLEHHVHRQVANAWWEACPGPIAFTRFTQISLLRLLTTAAAMDGQPLGMDEAWHVHDRLFSDDRVVLLPEPPASKRNSANTHRGERLRPNSGPMPGCWP